jgi:hypothetical protein
MPAGSPGAGWTEGIREMTFFKYIFAILLTIPFIAFGLHLFEGFTENVTGEKKKKIEKKREETKGFTIWIPDDLDDDSGEHRGESGEKH